MLSPYNKGLFRRAITQSGVALSPWALQKNPMALTKKVTNALTLDGNFYYYLVLLRFVLDMMYGHLYVPEDRP